MPESEKLAPIFDICKIVALKTNLGRLVTQGEPKQSKSAGFHFARSNTSYGATTMVMRNVTYTALQATLRVKPILTLRRVSSA